MTWITMIPVAGILFRAVYTDLKKGIIENRLMLIGLVSGFLVQILTADKIRVLGSVKSFFIMFAAMILVYAVKGIGAGDVKLLCVLAVFFPESCFNIVAFSFVIAAFIALIRIAVRLVKKESLFKKGEAICFSVPVAFATVITFILEVTG